MTTERRIAVIAGQRIPFTRSVTHYKSVGNKELMTEALRLLVQKNNLQGKTLGEVILGAVLKRSKDFSLARECTIDAGLSYQTPAMDIQKACGTSLEAAILIAQKIATGQMDCGIAGGTDTSSDVPIELSIPFSQKLVQMTKERNLLGRLGTFQGLGPKDLLPRIPGVKEPRTGLSMGEHCELMAQEWNISRQEQDELALQSHKRAAIAWENGFYNDLVGAYLGAQKDNNIRPDATIEGFKKLRPAFEQSAKGTLTAGNSSPLTDGAAAVLLGTDAWAKEAGLEPLAYLTHYQSAAINYNGEEGLLMAPAYAVSSMLTRAKLSLQDFDFYEIHEAFAAQVLCTLKAWNDDKFCRQRLGREGRLGDIDFSKLNVKGGSIAIGHPFAATGARILASAGKMLKEKGKGRALISICTAGGMGITAILER